ncbi:MAG: hypothetical protein BJ554DRAFT_6606 [Olpidium bornovanus]|uniref:Uncharacterized protein n=1 Tax=Olpidium bornovanus TaxID=278681 RepID=A0A8H7ZXF5_9FUNG|nr:MAG: hypothetical protein BJ554DRAFT_6606 [Olpidium bornovanus]
MRQTYDQRNKNWCYPKDSSPFTAYDSGSSAAAAGGTQSDDTGPARHAQGREVLKQIGALLSTMAAGKVGNIARLLTGVAENGEIFRGQPE